MLSSLVLPVLATLGALLVNATPVSVDILERNAPDDTGVCHSP
jgi:hypothetical protein